GGHRGRNGDIIRAATAIATHLEDIVPGRLRGAVRHCKGRQRAAPQCTPEGSHGTFSFPSGLLKGASSLLQHTLESTTKPLDCFGAPVVRADHFFILNGLKS